MADRANIQRFARGMVPVALVWLGQLLIFLPTRVLITNWYVPAFASLDAKIPFLPIFVFFYLGAFIQWVVCYLHFAFEDTDLTYRICSAHVLALAVCLVCFFALPFAIERPVPEGNPILVWLVNLVYAVDPPNRIFPSLHCLVSYYCTRRALALPTVSKAGKVWSVVLTCGVCLSTVFIKQHYVIDVIVGIALAEASILIAKRTGFDAAFRRLCNRIQDRLFPPQKVQ